ncbi:MAG: hypothetical protein GY856_48510 [bacterium]|nr:hypothetical protein [bacterium]
MAQVQSGVATIGPCGGLSKTVTVSFAETFTSTPTLVANTLRSTGYPWTFSDTFAVTVKSVSTSEAELRVYRVDGGSHWSQDLEVCWMAISPD